MALARTFMQHETCGTCFVYINVKKGFRAFVRKQLFADSSPGKNMKQLFSMPFWQDVVQPWPACWFLLVFFPHFSGCVRQVYCHLFHWAKVKIILLPTFGRLWRKTADTTPAALQLAFERVRSHIRGMQGTSLWDGRKLNCEVCSVQLVLVSKAWQKNVNIYIQ